MYKAATCHPVSQMKQALRCGSFVHSPTGAHSDTRVGPAWTWSPTLASCPRPHDSKTIYQMQVGVESAGVGWEKPQRMQLCFGFFS